MKTKNRDSYVKLLVPPQALDMETTILGGILVGGIDAPTIDMLVSSDFYREVHQVIFNAIRFLFDRNAPIDILTVADELGKNDQLDFVGGKQFLAKLVLGVNSCKNADMWVKIIIQKSLQRKLIEIGNKISFCAQDSLSYDVEDIISEAQKNIEKLSKRAEELRK